MNRLDRSVRNLLLRVRVLPVSGETVPAPDSADYLFLVQQAKRISLSKTVGRFSRRNMLLWPWLIVMCVMKYYDLVIANAIIRSFINEMDLQRITLDNSVSAASSNRDLPRSRPEDVGSTSPRS